MNSSPAITASEAMLGLDVAKKKVHVALLIGERLRYKVIANTPDGFRDLDRWLVQQRERLAFTSVRVALEPTGTYADDLAEHLYHAGHAVHLINPARVKAFATSLAIRGKTDKGDAAVLARFCQCQRLPLFEPMAPQRKTMRALLRHLDQLEQTRRQQANRLESAREAEVRASLKGLIEVLDERIEEVRRRVDELLGSDAELARQGVLLCSIPGLGSLTAARLLAELPAIEQFASARELAAYLGVVPRPHESGSSVRGRTPISKRGHARLRRALFFPALVAMQHNEVVRSFAGRLREQGKAPKEVAVAAVRKLAHIIYGVLKHGRPFDAKLAFSP